MKRIGKGRFTGRVGLLMAFLLLFIAAPAAGSLSFVDMYQDGVNGVEGLQGARAVTLSPDGTRVYVASEYGNSVAVFAREPATGSLTIEQTLFDGVNGIEGIGGAAGVTVSRDGEYVYVAGYGSDAIAVFSREDITGELFPVQVLRNGVDGVEQMGGPRMVAISSDGMYAYVPASLSGAVVVLARDPATGMLSHVDAVTGLGGTRSVTLSPDGAQLYADAFILGQVLVFERDPATGLLSVVQVVQQGVDEVEGLRFASSIAISPDGAHGYVTAGDFQTTPGDRSVTLFERDQATGELTFVETLRREESGTLSAQVSPDGTRVYVAGAAGLSGGVAAIDVYSRNATTGRLRLLQKVLDDENGVAGLGGLFDIALSPDGAHLYGAAREDNALTVFRVEHDICCGDANGDGQVTIDELVAAVNNALGGCPE